MRINDLSNADITAKSSSEYSSQASLHGSAEDARHTNKKDEIDYVIHEGQISQKHASLLIPEIREKEMEMDLDIASDPEMTLTRYPGGGFSSLCMYRGENLVHTSSEKDIGSLKKEMACHTISLPIDSGKHELHCTALGPDREFNSGESLKDITATTYDAVHGYHRETFHAGESDTASRQPHRGQINTLSKLIADSAKSLQREKFSTGSTSFHANLVRDEHAILKQSSLVDTSQEKSTIAIADCSLLESSIPSPASWDSSFRQYSPVIDTIHTHKKWASSSQKPVVVVVPPKEPAKGLKRLLKFARKSRGTPEVIIADCLTTMSPDGDHVSEDPKARIHSLNNLLKLGVNDRMLMEFSRQNGVSSVNGNSQEKRSGEEAEISC